MDTLSVDTTEFRCAICRSMLQIPCATTCCQQLFCEQCIRMVMHLRHPCPNCRGLEWNYRSCTPIERIISNLPSQCPNKERGCLEKITIGTRADHEGLCNFKPVSCPSIGCDDGEIVLKDLDDHLNDCPARLIGCEFCVSPIKFSSKEVHLRDYCPNNEVFCELCNQNLLRKDLERHIAEVCPLALISCRFAYMGCTAKMRRQDSGLHVITSTCSHFQLAVSALNATLRLLGQEKKRTTNLQGANLELFQKSEDLEQKLKDAEQKNIELDKSNLEMVRKLIELEMSSAYYMKNNAEQTMKTLSLEKKISHLETSNKELSKKLEDGKKSFPFVWFVDWNQACKEKVYSSEFFAFGEKWRLSLEAKNMSSFDVYLRAINGHGLTMYYELAVISSNPALSRCASTGWHKYDHVDCSWGWSNFLNVEKITEENGFLKNGRLEIRITSMSCKI